jgi:hypothetical protein
VEELKKGQILTLDIIIAFIVVAVMIYITISLLQETFTFEDEHIHTMIRDAAFALEITNLENISDIIENTPIAMCFSLNVKTYDKESLLQLNSTYYHKQGCRFLTGKKFINKRTIIIDEYNYSLISLEGWYK